MEMEWTWNLYGMEMESIFNGSFHVHSMSIPYGFHSAYGMRKWLGPQPKSFHMDSMEWIWNPYGLHCWGWCLFARNTSISKHVRPMFALETCRMFSRQTMGKHILIILSVCVGKGYSHPP